MKIKIMDNWPDVQALRKEILETLQTSTANTLYATPEWMESWFSTLGNSALMRFIAAFEDEHLVGFLPLVVSKGRWIEFGGKRIEFISGRRADYHDAIVPRQRETEITPGLLEGALKSLDHTDFVVLHHIPEESPSLSIFRNILIDHGLRVGEIVSKAPYLSLDRSVPNFGSQWGKNHWKNLKWQRNRLMKLGRLALTIYDDPKEVFDKLPNFFETHKEGWLARGKRSLVGNDSQTQAFFRCLVLSIGCTNPQKRIHFSTLDLNGQVISYHFGFVYQDALLYYVPTYSLDFEEYSPGKVHLHFLIEHGLTKESWKVFDFLVGDEPYKYMWTRTERKVYTLLASERFSPGAVRRWWLVSGKDRARDYLNKVRRLRLLRS